jgi:hypothetical protein
MMNTDLTGNMILSNEMEAGASCFPNLDNTMTVLIAKFSSGRLDKQSSTQSKNVATIWHCARTQGVGWLQFNSQTETER